MIATHHNAASNEATARTAHPNQKGTFWFAHVYDLKSVLANHEGAIPRKGNAEDMSNSCVGTGASGLRGVAHIHYVEPIRPVGQVSVVAGHLNLRHNPTGIITSARCQPKFPG